MSKYEKHRLGEELRDLESERLRLARELHAHGSDGPEAVYMSAQILRHRISLALLRSIDFNPYDANNDPNGYRPSGGANYTGSLIRSVERAGRWVRHRSRNSLQRWKPR